VDAVLPKRFRTTQPPLRPAVPVPLGGSAPDTNADANDNGPTNVASDSTSASTPASASEADSGTCGTTTTGPLASTISQMECGDAGQDEDEDEGEGEDESGMFNWTMKLSEFGAELISDPPTRTRFVRDDSLLKQLGKIKAIDNLTSESSVRDLLYQTWSMTAGFKRHANYKRVTNGIGLVHFLFPVMMHVCVPQCELTYQPNTAVEFWLVGVVSVALAFYR
jgi:hypothetical protein